MYRDGTAADRRQHWQQWTVLIALMVVVAGMMGAHVPTASAQAPASLEGTWIVSTSPDNPGAREVVVFAPGGIVLATNQPVRVFAPGEGPPGVTRQFSSQGFGVWASLGDGVYAFKFVVIGYTEAGDFYDTATITGRLTLGAGGKDFSGTFSVSVALPQNQTLVVEADVPLTGTRLTIDSGG